MRVFHYFDPQPTVSSLRSFALSCPPDGAATDTLVIWERIEWALCAGLMVAYAVTYAMLAAF